HPAPLQSRPVAGNEDRSSRYTAGQRVALWVVPRAAALLITAIGFTLRFEDLLEPGATVETPPNSGIYCFWHQCTLLAAWRFRPFHPCVLISRSFDGELVARTLALLGYRTVRGSSSRGAVASLLGLRAVVQAGTPAVFTADGPRGPIHQAKPGPLKLAQITGSPIGSFHLQPARAWTLRSWDQFMIPMPFTRVVVAWSRKLPAPTPDAGPQDLEATRLELDQALERARLHALAHLAARRTHLH
ncbi:MAG TPA: lysophospholipid acyltransferase family protein, partial [Acidobacteriaceae bacterium]